VDALLNLKDLGTWPTEIIHLISDYSLPLPGIFTFCGFGEHRRAAFLTVDGDMTILASMSCERSIAAAVRIDDNIYVTGGSGDTGTYLSSMERYHLPTRRWSSLPSMSSPRSGHANVRINDDCFMVIGGIVPGPGDTTCEVYNTVTNKWSVVASSTTPRDSFASVSLKGKVYVFGGNSYSDEIASCEVYDIKSNQWSSVASLQVPLHLRPLW
jgi:N-acetylneuraminic acid mutarotase